MEKLLTIGRGLANDTEIQHVAERDEFELLQAADRADGLATLRAQQPSVVLVDHELEGDDGVEVLKEIRQIDPGCEVILVTSGGEMDAAIEVLRAGALDYVRRPIDGHQLGLALGRARERRGQRQTLESSTILVVDDHAATLKQVVNVLEKEGYRVFGASDGAEAMRLFEENRIDIILSDLLMPGKSGLELLRETKGAGADVEVIVVTGHGDEGAVVQALRDGAINFLKKPVEVEQMLLAIEKALEHQTLRHSLAYRNRDMELMQELVIRLNQQLELVVETPLEFNAATIDFFHQLVDALPFGIVVLGSDRRITFANRHVMEKTKPVPKNFSADWIRPMGLPKITDEHIVGAFDRAMKSKPGFIETLAVSKWAFMIMTPLRIIRPGGAERYIAVAIRGERKQNNV